MIEKKAKKQRTAHANANATISGFGNRNNVPNPNYLKF
jgi:hypothetical protein